MRHARPLRRGDQGAPRHAIGIDIGGTKIAGAIVNLATGALARRRQAPARAERGGEAVLEDVLAVASDLVAAARREGIEPVGLGVGVPELVDHQGEVFSGHRVDWRGLPARDRLDAVLPAHIEADIRAAALAEARLGAGQGIDDFIYVSVGTGVSAVLVQGGRPYRGSRGAALVVANGRPRFPCAACGHRDALTLEEVASGPGLAAALGLDRAEDVLALAQEGDPRAIEALDHASGELGQALALLAGALDPAAIIVGGGLGSAPGRYIEGLRRSIAEGLWDADARHLPVMRAALGPDAGLVGAALVAAPDAARDGAESAWENEST